MFTYYPKGVCSKKMSFSLYDTGQGMVIEDIKIEAGCDGNLKGICKLVEGRAVEEVIELLENIQCGRRETSCPDQLAKALKRAAEEQGLDQEVKRKVLMT